MFPNFSSNQSRDRAKSQSPERKRRGSLSGLFDNLQIKSNGSTNASRNKSRKSKPLPIPPAEETLDPTICDNKITPIDFQNQENELNSFPPFDPTVKYADVKRICMPDPKYQRQKHTSQWKLVESTDQFGRLENHYVDERIGRQLFACDHSSRNKLPCCLLCDHSNWIFLGSEYDPHITLLYAHMDGCIPSSVKLTDPKFIIPWRYKNRKTGAISWKVIHMCGSQVTDAECETIIVNHHRDKRLKQIIDAVKKESVWYSGAKLVEYLLKVVRLTLGNYGLAGGATSSEADTSLYKQMEEWNLITLEDEKEKKMESYLIDPTSPHFTWTKHGSVRMKAYKIDQESSFGHGGITMKLNGIL
ncbi:hypothetical protein HDV02_000429 [Globomyces sp. JEL0801]|nr:hypothetical protein HDV02_000429 [Globomyces sp. JEL0801]